MNDIPDTARDRDSRLENLAAELTRAVAPLVLRHGPKELLVTVELGLWSALAETVRKWARQKPAASSDGLEAWRQAFFVDLTECAFRIALNNGVNGPLLELASGLHGAVRPVIWRCGRVGE